jgi:hypothetical protein
MYMPPGGEARGQPKQFIKTEDQPEGVLLGGCGQERFFWSTVTFPRGLCSIKSPQKTPTLTC